jgi:hypothetical protein
MKTRAEQGAKGALLTLALCATTLPAWGQAIQMTQERFAAPAALPFAAPAPKPAPAPPAPPRPSFVLKQDRPIHLELQAWAAREGWQLHWHPEVSWRVLRDADLSGDGDVSDAVARVIEILREEGKPLRLQISDGNRVMEVLRAQAEPR